MKILLTGATGFVGSHLARELVDRGHKVCALVRSPARGKFLEEMGVQLVPGSLEALDKPDVILPEVDGVIHNAGLIKALKAEEYYRVNVEGTKKLVCALKRATLKNFVFVSSISARGPNRRGQDLQGTGPVSHYGKSKLEAENFLLSCRDQFPVTIVRPPIVYGPGDPETLRLFKMFRRGFLAHFPKGIQRVSFIFVNDLARLLVAAVKDSRPGPGPYHPDDGRGGYNWDEVVEIAARVHKRPVRKINLPLWAAKACALASEAGGRIFGYAPFLTREKYKELLCPDWTCGDPRIVEKFRLDSLTDLQSGFVKAREWYEKEGWL
ncbi:MAG: NAD-dependent epimerase/dehydratase family protein [Deltaproteobacteria bacterium]|nr:NAD-dependent epimerase/dehydratase family protein [Deltaproteobacteria bacterium]